MAEQEMMQRITETLTCCVCMDADKDTVLMPCKHLCVCESCSHDIRTCPLCRVEVTDKIRVWTGMERQPSPKRMCVPAAAESHPQAFTFECPLHGPQCPAGPFADRDSLDFHVNAALDGEDTPPPQPAQRDVHQTVEGGQLVCMPPSPIVIEPKNSVEHTGAWGMSHHVYFFNMHVLGETFYFGARYSALKKLSDALRELSPPTPFPSSEWWAWVTGTSSNHKVNKRHQDLAAWLQDLFAPRAVMLKRVSGAMDAGAVCYSSIVTEALGLPPASARVLAQVGDQRRAWFTNATNIIASFGVPPGTRLCASVPPAIVNAP